MDTMAEDTRLPADIDAQPVVQAAAALQPVHPRLPRGDRARAAPAAAPWSSELHAAGFYRMVIPRSLGGLQVDPLTYLRVVELLAEGAGSVGWNLANNSIGQLVTLGLPDEGVQEIHGQGTPSVIAGTAVQGGGQAVPVEGGYRVNGHWTFGSGCQESSWMLGSFQILDDGQPRRRPDGGSLYWRGVFPRAEATVVPGSWDVAGLRGTGSFDWTVKDVFLPERRTLPARRRPAGQPVVALAGADLRLAEPVLGRAASQLGDHRHRARRHRCADRSGGREDAARPRFPAVRQPAGAGRASDARMRS